MRSRLSLLLFLGAMVILCFVIFPLSASEDIFYDSSYQYFLTQHSFSEMAQLIPEDYSPPLYAYLLKLHTLIFGKTLFAMRAFSLLAAGGMLYLSAFPVRKAFGGAASVICTILTLCSTVNLRLLSDIRPLIFAMFFNMALVVYSYIAYKDENKCAYVCMTIFSVLAMYTHYIALLSAFGVYITVIAFSVIGKEYKKLRKFFISGVICAAAYIPWLLVLLRQLDNVKSDYWVVRFSFISAFEYILWKPFGLENSTMAFMNMIIRLLICAAFAAAILRACRSEEFKNADKEKLRSFICSEKFRGGLLLILMLVVPVAVFALFALIIYPAATQRYFFIFEPVWIMILSAFLGNLCPRKLTCCVSAAVVVNFCMAAVNHGIEMKENTLEEMNDYIISRDGEQPAFLHLHEGTLGIMSYYFPNARHYVCSDTYTVLRTYDVFTTDIRTNDDICDIAAHENSFYIFDSNYAHYFKYNDCEVEFIGDYSSSYGMYESGFGLNRITTENNVELLDDNY